jgi:hypothetical protein
MAEWFRNGSRSLNALRPYIIEGGKIGPSAAEAYPRFGAE